MGYGSNPPKRGRSSSAGRAAKIEAWGDRSPSQDDAGELESVPGLIGAISLVAEAGDAITITKTSAGDCWSVTVTCDGHRAKKYPRGQDELDECFRSIADVYQSVAEMQARERAKQ